MEKWKPIKGWEEFYEISSKGRVKRLPRKFQDRWGRWKQVTEKIWEVSDYKETKDGIKILSVNAQFIKTKLYIRKEVARAFIPNPNNYKYIRLRDKDNNNLNVDNIEWGRIQ